MGNVRRVYVEKKPDFAVKAKELKHEVKHYLGIAAEGVRVLIRYDVENVSDDTYRKHCRQYSLSLRSMIYMKKSSMQRAAKYFPLSSYRDSSIREPIPQSSV